MLHHMLRAAAQRAFNVLDPYFQYVTMLLHGNGTNGAQNNTFLDSSTNNFTITRNGNTTQGTFTPYGSNWSNYFNGSNSNLSVPTNTAFDFSTGDFTVECWVYMTQYNAGNYQPIFSNAYLFYIGNAGEVLLFNGTSNVVTGSSGDVPTNSWNHIAFVRNGSGTNNTKIYVNGIQKAQATVTASIGSISPNLIGKYSTVYFPGYISNFRVVKGTAVYTSAFTPSITPLTAITNTSLLTCADNRFIDESTNAFAITKVGDTSVQRFSPFSPTTAYSTSVIGGSGYFDGAVDSLTVPTNAAFGYGTGDFTIEFWLYLNSTGLQTVFSNLSSDTSTNPHLYISTTIRYFTASADRITGATLSTGTWYHIALCKSSGSTRLFINGTQSGSTYTDSNNYGSSAPLGIGTYWSGGSPVTSNTVNGYITDARVLKGTALYTTTFTPPTAPLTAITNTSLLLSYTNAGILDNAMMNNLETVGNAQISTSVKKYGTGSMYFDGSGDRLYEPSNQNFNFGTGDFTIELWANPISQGGHGSGNNDCLVDFRPGSTGVYGTLYIFSSGTGVYWYVNGANRITGGAISNGSWTHIAVCRASGSTKLFLNGVQSGSTYTDTNNYLVAPIMIGEFNDGTGGGNFYGYIDDLRITKGVARYTANFTAPTAAFPNN